MDFLKTHDIYTAFHYVPLHRSPAGLKYGRFVGEDRFTSSESGRLLRLPIYYGMERKTIDYVVEMIFKFYGMINS